MFVTETMGGHLGTEEHNGPIQQATVLIQIMTGILQAALY